MTWKKVFTVVVEDNHDDSILTQDGWGPDEIWDILNSEMVNGMSVTVTEKK